MPKLKSDKRRTKRPSKQLLFLLVGRFLREHQYETAVDLACGTMSFANLVRARNYIAVDLDLERLREGKAENPHAIIVHSRVEELPTDISGDLVLCLQCVGTNKHFDNQQAIKATEHIVAATRAGGDLVFNVGSGASGCFEEIDGRVKQAFVECRRFDYGRFNRSVAKGRPGLVLSMVLAQLMLAFPGLAHSPHKRLYLCRGKHPP